eukprot:TRINITY_DN941_c0_g1_i3.p1 TRINITY_DN941_c0_g1~~TRINITY_DN941_c0_g1_i3.p1  ORF type:complete len:368 (+),score=118.36 TRINITY_DN941_c0_g1_i3:73-1176(+)
MRTTLATLAAVSSLCFCHGEWAQIGKAMPEERVTAVSLDFDPDGLPAFAFGFNQTGGGTVIPVMAWNGVEWEQDTRRVSQFPQGYHEFNFKVRNYVKYIGLKIHYRYGSVLNGAVEWRGSYAFHNDLFDYDIDSKGNMMMLWVSTQPTTSSYPGTDNKLVIERYSESGWTGYPSGPAFGPQTPVDKQTDKKKVTDVKLIRGANADSFVGGYVLGGVAKVFNDSRTFEALGGTWEGSALDIVYSNSFGTVASYIKPGSSSVDVRHFPVSGSKWVELGVAIPTTDTENKKTTLALTADGTVVVAAPAKGNATIVHTSTYTLGESSAWKLNSFEAAGPVTHWDMGANGFNVWIVLSENDGKGVRVVRSDF